MSEPLPPPRLALLFMFITVLLSIVGLGIIIPVMPTLITELTGTNVSEAASLGGYLLFVYAAAQFVMSPILGGLSDRYGRRPVLLISLVAYAFDFLLMAMAPTYWFLFAGRAISGATAATYSTANAVIADVSPPEKRAANFGLMGAAFGLGFIIGPVVGGWLGEYGPRVPFFAAAGVSAANAVFGFFSFPETLKEKRSFDWKRANPAGALMSVGRYRYIYGVLLSYFFMMFAHNALPATFSYFAEFKFAWSPQDIGLALGFVGILAAIVQGGLTRVMIPKIGETRAVVIGSAAMAASFIGYAFFTPTGAWVYLWIVVGAFGGFSMPGMQGIMSSSVPSDSQGELQGAIAAVMSLTMMTSPLIMTMTFTHFTNGDAGMIMPGAPLILGALLIGVSIVPFTLTMLRKPALDQASPGVRA